MSELATARETLLAEVAKLAARLEAIVPALDASREALVRSGENVAGQIGSFETGMAAVAEKARTVAVRHIALPTTELARSSSEAQTRAIEQGASALFRSELGPAMRCLARPLQQLFELQPCPFDRRLTSGAVAVLSSSLTRAAAAWLWSRRLSELSAAEAQCGRLCTQSELLCRIALRWRPSTRGRNFRSLGRNQAGAEPPVKPRAGPSVVSSGTF